jgi:hypothetical protein
MRISFVACGNGYGHMKRTLQVVEKILKYPGDHSVQIVGATFHQQIFDEWASRVDAAGGYVSFVNGLTETNLGVKLPPTYTVDDYHKSLKYIHTQVQTFKPEVVVSDNLVGVLKYYPDAILMGSFVWGDVLEGGVMNEIATMEDELLRKTSPEMIGVKDLAMPGVLKKTRFVAMPWFCDPDDVSRTSRSSGKSILVTGGGTDVLGKWLAEIANDLASDPELQVYVDSRLDGTVAGAERFSFQPEDFRNLDWIVCRPGAGILTDSVRFRVPVCAVADDNKEMVHNADCIARLGIGFRHVRTDQSRNAIKKGERAGYQATFEKLETGGAARAAEYILKRSKG